MNDNDISSDSNYLRESLLKTSSQLPNASDTQQELPGTLDNQQELLSAVAPPLSAIEAKAKLLFGTTENNDIAESYAVPSSTDIKAKLLGARISKKREAIGKTGNEGPDWQGIPHRFLSEENKKLAFIEQARKTQAIQESKDLLFQNKDALLLADQADTALGGAANTSLALVGGAARVVGAFITFVPETGNLIDSLGIAPEEFQLHKIITQKQNIGEPLSEAEQTYVNNNQDTLDNITDINSKQEFINLVKIGVESVESWSNSTKLDKAMAEVGKQSTIAADQFTEGNYTGGIATVLKSMGSLAKDNPAATLELLANTLPQMIVLAKTSVTGVVSLSLAGYGEAIKEFETEYGRTPDDSERTVALLLSTVAAGLDKLGSNVTLNGSTILKSVKKLQKEAKLVVAKKTFDKATSALGKVTTKALKASLGLGVSTAKNVIGNKTIKSIAVESSTEGAQNVLSQLAGKQDLSKISGSEAITDFTVGGVVGGVLTRATEIPKTLSKIAITANKGANIAAKSVLKVTKKVRIGNSAKVVAAAEADNDYVGVLNELISVNTAEYSNEEIATHINKIADSINVLHEELVDPKISKEREIALGEQVAKFDTVYDNLVSDFAQKKNKASAKETSIAVNTLENRVDTITEESITNNISVISNNINSGSTLPAASANRLLGSDSTFVKYATPEQIKELKAYKEYKEKIEELQTLVANNKENPKSTGQVNSEVLEGGKGFTGLKQYLSTLTAAIVKGDKTTAEQTINAIFAFGKQHSTKLRNGYLPKGQTQLYTPDGELVYSNYKPHVGTTLENITLEVDALIQTYRQAKRMYKNEFGEVSKKTSPESKVESKVETSTEPKAKPVATEESSVEKETKIDESYETLVKDLKSVVIEKEYDVEGKIITFKHNIGLELANVDAELNGLQEIWESCKYG